MALTTTSHEVYPFPIRALDPELPPPPPVAITPCDPWPRPYYLENGLRRVAPYHYTYNTFCKQRWRGREILDIFAAEFRDRSREYYKNAIEEGHIVINGKPCMDVHTIVNNGDVISHTLHRHEPPVTAQPIKVINETDDMIVIDKPAGVPVHPAGRYNYNSIVEIMRAERHYTFNPLPCNRLDRLTSGVMFIGKTSKEAEAISEKLRGRTVRKEYVARVKGRFPDGEGWEGNVMKGGVVNCEESILQISPILGLNRARASGKSAKTLFRRIAYYPAEQKTQKSDTSTSAPLKVFPSAASNISGPTVPAQPAPPLPSTEDSGYSIVHCLPLTGRTHQIRVHLQFLGHPITNDPIYSNRRVFGPTLAQNDASADHDSEIIERLGKMGKTETFADALDPTIPTQTMQTTVPKNSTSSVTNTYKPLNSGTLHAGPTTAPTSSTEASAQDAAYVAAHDEMVADYNRRKGEKMTGEACPVCDTPLYSDPGPQELGIYLHALAYSDVGGQWDFRSPMPTWAMPPSEQAHGPREIRRWEYDGSETLDGIGDEMENRRIRNERGAKTNKGVED